MENRREKFRRYMRRLAPASPAYAIRDGLYVSRPTRSVSEQIASRLELEPTAAHVVVGGIGSGKTTELLVAQDRLTQTADIRASYIDVAEHHDLAQIKMGVLVALVGLRLSELLNQSAATDEARQAAEKVKEWARGSVKWVESISTVVKPPPPIVLPQAQPVRRAGILIPPKPVLRSEIKEMVDELAKLMRGLDPPIPHLVMFFDSLDRLTSISPYAALVEQDVTALQSIGIGVVATGPLLLLYGTGRPIADRFTMLHHVPAVNVHHEANGETFLSRVLTTRIGTEVIDEAALHFVVEQSGGVLRDLLSLARGSLEEAYLSGEDQIKMTHVLAAAESFGRTLMLGLGSEEISVLKRVHSVHTFVQTSDKDIALLLTRRVLEYVNTRTSYAVHPTIAPLLAALTK